MDIATRAEIETLRTNLYLAERRAESYAMDLSVLREQLDALKKDARLLALEVRGDKQPDLEVWAAIHRVIEATAVNVKSAKKKKRPKKRVVEESRST